MRQRSAVFYSVPEVASISESESAELLIGLRLNEAARLLSSGTHNVKQAAEAVGILDIYYFSRLFKKRFLCPPSNFRNRVPKL